MLLEYILNLAVVLAIVGSVIGIAQMLYEWAGHKALLSYSAGFFMGFVVFAIIDIATS